MAYCYCLLYWVSICLIGGVQNVNQAFIETELDSYRQALEDYLNNQQPNASVADVIGSKTIIQRTNTNPPAELPYAQIRAQQAISEIPDNLRHKFQFELQTSAGSTLLNHTANTAEIAGKQLAFSFSPATDTDEQALLAYLPDNPQSPEDLPNTIPVGLFNVVGEYSVDGDVLATSSSLSFGQELKTEKGLWSPQDGWALTSNPIITGEYQAIGLDLHGIAPTQLANLQTNLTATQDQITNSQFDNLTKHDVVGDLLQSGVISYLAITDVQAQLAAQSSDIVYYREPSYGTFSTTGKINYFFGVPQSVEMTGVLMDMDRMKTSAECKTNCWNNWVDFNRSTGAAWSAYEHLVPEQIFSTDENPVEGVSAVKALAVAAQQGQRIYTITQDNRAAAINALSIDQTVINEINTAVQSGMEVTVSQHNINYAGWTGVGYIITDPEVGSGAYKISGGANGGELILDALSTAGTLFGALAIISEIIGGFSIIHPLLLLLVTAAEAIGSVANAMQSNSNCENSYALEIALLVLTFQILTIIAIGIALPLGPIGWVLSTAIFVATDRFVSAAKESTPQCPGA